METLQNHNNSHVDQFDSIVNMKHQKETVCGLLYNHIRNQAKQVKRECYNSGIPGMVNPVRFECIRLRPDGNQVMERLLCNNQGQTEVRHVSKLVKLFRHFRI